LEGGGRRIRQEGGRRGERRKCTGLGAYGIQTWLPAVKRNILERYLHIPEKFRLKKTRGQKYLHHNRSGISVNKKYTRGSFRGPVNLEERFPGHYLFRFLMFLQFLSVKISQGTNFQDFNCSNLFFSSSSFC
jgi:hypothetical protein